MSWLHHPSIALATLLWLVGVAAPLRAQTVYDPRNVRIHFGPLALAPSIRLTNVGEDTNVLNESDDNNPKRDLTATASPAVDVWLRMRRLRLTGRSQLDYFYLRELTDLRALNTVNSLGAELVLTRLTAYAEGSLTKTRSRQGLEIDAFAQRQDDTSRVGADVRLTGKGSAGLYVGRSGVDYEAKTLYQGTNLAFALNRTTTVQGVRFRYAATPLTTVGISAEQQQDRFEFSAERSSDTVRVMPQIEFKPFALISGRAAVGFRRVRFIQGDVPEFKGAVADVDLTYTMRGRTQFTVAGRRDLRYSYLDLQNVYVLAGFTVSATQRIGDGWDLRGSVGRFRLNYRNTFQSGTGLAAETTGTGETDVSFGVDLGYHIGRSRIGFNVDHHQRSSFTVGRHYERLVVGSSLAYTF